MKTGDRVEVLIPRAGSYESDAWCLGTVREVRTDGRIEVLMDKRSMGRGGESFHVAPDDKTLRPVTK